MKSEHKSLALLVSCALAGSPAAYGGEKNEKEELLTLRNTTLNLIELLVQQGILDKGKADQMIRQAEQKAAAEAKAEARREAEQSASVGGGARPEGKDGASGKAEKSKGEPGTVRVTYVPDFVKDEIRAEVRKELKDEVVKEVKANAKQEKWGVPAALPDWVNRFKLFGDFMVRSENQFFGSSNRPNTYFNWPAINAAGGITQLGDPYRNTTNDFNLWKLRMRLGLEAKITDELQAQIRLTTSNQYSPISTNQVMGQYGTGYQVQLDRAFLQYDYLDDKGQDWVTLWAGRMANPWFSTDNTFDPDLNFEGFSGTFRFPFGHDYNAEVIAYHVVSTAGRQQFNWGYTKPNEAYLTLGAFPLEQDTLFGASKYLWAAQGGMDYLFNRNNRFKIGVAYYDYNNTQARRDPLGSTKYDWTAPQFFTQGNSLARISNDLNSSTEPRLVGLASKFEIFDVTATYDYTGFYPQHVMLIGSYSHNFGFDQQQIYNTLGEDLQPRTNAFEARFEVGEPNIQRFGDWNVWLAYKYLEADSVLDAFTDSNFHAYGGTNAKGWELAGNYAIANNTWLGLNWLSSSVISGPTYNVNTLLIDLNARF
ncbi:putative porin [Methylococcus geothermalis]|uniref:Porin n=1 Tax=Methylococcus geothermalis TaxID=2681310 RepID=A0A858Q8T9_9GAMM|nr:putative porin [Methylococcus geothermalis]QJD30269.1 hypothetical protein GNH96_09990 [Methylococcus geothermalis]